MVIIIEGLDGVGKTTIAKKIAEKYNYEYIKESYTDDCKQKEKRVVEMLQRVLSGNNYIYDRTTLIDDFVYSALNKKESTLVDYIDIIDDILSRCKIFYLVIDEAVRKKRFENRGDEYITNDMIDQLRSNYENFFNEKKFNPVLYLLGEDSERDADGIMEVVKTI